MTGLRITKADVDWIVARGLLRGNQVAPLGSAWNARHASSTDVAPRWLMTHVLHCVGGMAHVAADAA